MHWIVCLDDRNGMTFGGRRLSRDRVLTQHILDGAKPGALWIKPCSADLFGQDAQVKVCASFAAAGEDCVCFSEDEDIMPYLRQVKTLTIYRWNRRYPADMYFPLDAVCADRTPERICEFPGYSHEVITEVIYHL